MTHFIKKVLLVAIVSFSFVTSVHADILVVVRATVLRKSHDKTSVALEKLKEGDTLVLKSTKQIDGYYQVSNVKTGKQGWVYRTFVRRFSNDAIACCDTEAVTGQSDGDMDSVSVRVVDVGAGLCTLIRLPQNKYVIYDAGGVNTSDGESTFEQIIKFIPAGTTIELMVISHMDADHTVAIEQVINNYDVKKIVYTGYTKTIDNPKEKETGAYTRMLDALAKHPGVINVNLHDNDSTIMPGNKIQISGATIKLLCGFGKPPAAWHLPKGAESLNGVSIVMKLEYKGSSVLFAGDAVGRHKGDPENVCIATEKFLVDKAGADLASTVLISAHHGAENGSSLPFLQKVNPDYIVISAGNASRYKHPRAETGKRYSTFTKTKVLRTDRGDDEGEEEWDFLRIEGCKDGINDDDIQIDLRSDGKCKVYYLDPRNFCVEKKPK